MTEKRPIIITIIGDLSILAAMLSIGVTIFPDYFSKLGFHHNTLPIYSNSVMNILLSFVLITAAAGYLNLKKWGYWLMIIYNIFLMLVNVIWRLQNKQIPFTTGIIVLSIVLMNTIRYRKYFILGAEA
ncbi:hypothetical protein [Ruminiclostridium cellulolyticum]|uniref:Uncharacterized protein n=1 Tax=Ruminiclostridium cellulolyticum (strain ATCC 35319 / DSM 5812 / JCM 6584 / H10) TaxID=394503 RepID=B8I4M3_RUMCH|nr:hypothetical protein [Ruminiclostridium cellulolyticum]ACL74577.1 conserved hypothetical protein [Ruminiclostridium cellulolyticum H10]